MTLELEGGVRGLCTFITVVFLLNWKYTVFWLIKTESVTDSAKVATQATAKLVRD